MVVASFPFGKHRGEPLDAVPGSYLEWAMRTCRLSSGLRQQVADELQRRGIDPPPPPAPTWRPEDRACPGAGIACHWLEDSSGRKRIRAECVCCGRYLGHPPCVPPYSTMADEAGADSHLLDVLVELDAIGVELQSDGKKAWLCGEDERRVSQRLRRLLRSYSHSLALLLGSRRTQSQVCR